MRFIARDKEEVAVSPVDFFSIGHVLMGQLSFFVVHLVIWYGIGYHRSFEGIWCLVTSVIIGILWEPFENVVLMRYGMKFEDKRDTLVNSVFDILFVTMGGLIAFSIRYWWLNFTLVLLEFALFFYLRWKILVEKEMDSRLV